MLSSRLARLALVSRTLNKVNRLTAIRCSSNVPAKYTDREKLEDIGATMDDLPVPMGSWEEGYKWRNAKYNRQLFISTFLCIVLTIYLYQANYLYTHPLVDLDEFEKWRKAKKAAQAAAAAGAAEEE